MDFLKLIFVFVCLWSSSSGNTYYDIDLSVPDLRVSVHEKDSDFFLDVFKSKLNDEILSKKNQQLYSHLSWYSLGSPKILSQDFEFDSNGFFVRVGFLSKEHKDSIKQQIKIQYSLDVDLNQIRNLPLDKFECSIEVRDEHDLDYSDTINGNVRNLNRYPFKLYFLNDKNVKSRHMLIKTINESREPILFQCNLEYGEDDSHKKTFELSYYARDFPFANKPEIVQIFDKHFEEFKHSAVKLTEKQSQIMENIVKINKGLEDKNSKSDQMEQITKIVSDLETKLKGLEAKSVIVQADLAKSVQEAELRVNKSVTTQLENIFQQMNQSFTQLIDQEFDSIKNKVSSIEESYQEQKVRAENFEEMPSTATTTTTTLKKFPILGKNVKTISGENSVYFLLVLSNNQIAAGYGDGTIKIINPENGQIVKTLKEHSGGVNCLIEDGNYLLSGSSDTTVKMWDMRNWNYHFYFTGFEDGVDSLMMLSNKRLAISYNQGDISIFNLKSNPYMFMKRFKAHSKLIPSMIKLKNSNHFVTASYDNTIKIWNADTYKLINTLNNHKSSVMDLVEIFEDDVDLNEAFIISAGWDGTLIAWAFEDGEIINRNEYETGINKVRRIVANEKFFCITSDDSFIYCYDNLDSNLDLTLKVTLKGHESDVYSLNILPNGNLISGSKDRTIKIWN